MMNTAAPQWFDTHVHLDVFGALTEVAAVAEAARHVGVCGCVVPGVAPDGWDKLLAVAAAVPGAWAAPGLHPQAASAWNRDCARTLESLLDDAAVVAVGEIGLDSLCSESMDAQETALRAQLRLALAKRLPVLIHCRRAFGRLLQILDEEGAERVGGILHAFSGSLETARAAIRRNFAISFAGSLTYPGARRAPQLLAALPAEWIVLETDAPDLAPVPRRGEENRPAYLPLVGAAVAEIRGWSLPETARITTANAHRILGI